MVIARRQFLFLGGSACLGAAGGDFWNSQPPSQWDRGQIYQLLNRSPWARPVQWYRPFAPAFSHGLKGVVTWESAQPIRDAVRTPLPWILESSYVIGVDGVPSAGHSAGYLRRFVSLRSTGKRKWKVGATLARELIRTSPVYAFGFPRTAAPIGPETGDVIFEMRIGPWRIEAKFKPREMTYRGQPAL